MIGFFDSGVGGLTVAEAVRKWMPRYGIQYLGDAARAPYGPRTHDELVAFTWQGTEWLFAQGCELVIVACNSASASALREIQQTRLAAYPGRRILGVIRPTVEALAERGHRRILVLSTVATAESSAYPREFQKIDPGLEIRSRACPRWAPMLEVGWAGTPEMAAEVRRELAEAAGDVAWADAILLACTHYPYLRADVEAAVPSGMPVYTQESIVAVSLEEYLCRHPEMESRLEKNGGARYATTGDPDPATRIATERFGFPVRFERISLG
jgi:glutamate racemase